MCSVYLGEDSGLVVRADPGGPEQRREVLRGPRLGLAEGLKEAPDKGGGGGTLRAGGDERGLETGPGEGSRHGRPQPWSKAESRAFPVRGCSLG